MQCRILSPTLSICVCLPACQFSLPTCQLAHQVATAVPALYMAVLLLWPVTEPDLLQDSAQVLAPSP